VLGVLTLLAAVSLVFMMVHMIPGDPVHSILGDTYTPEAGDRLAEQLGLNKPVWRQYLTSMANLFQGDLGQSFKNKQPVFDQVMLNLRYTAQLAVAGIIVTILIGIPLGMIAALNKGKLADLAATSFSLIGASMPSFWLGILLMIVFSVRLQWLPLLGAGQNENLLGQMKFLILPALTLGLRSAALMARVTRSSLLEVLGQDYIRTARAKGLHEARVVRGHALRNAMLPVVTVIGVDLGRMLGGAAIVEIVFGRPGIGNLLVSSVVGRDYPLIQGTFVIYLAIIILVNLAVDLLYGRLDPRISFR
jgi:ABC-type dipeptide/oligopeptide/nickel transport system permease component